MVVSMIVPERQNGIAGQLRLSAIPALLADQSRHRDRDPLFPWPQPATPLAVVAGLANRSWLAGGNEFIAVGIGGACIDRIRKDAAGRRNFAGCHRYVRLMNLLHHSFKTGKREATCNSRRSRSSRLHNNPCPYSRRYPADKHRGRSRSYPADHSPCPHRSRDYPADNTRDRSTSDQAYISAHRGNVSAGEAGEAAAGRPGGCRSRCNRWCTLLRTGDGTRLTPHSPGRSNRKCLYNYRGK